MILCTKCQSPQLHNTLFCDQCGEALVEPPAGVDRHVTPKSHQFFVVVEGDKSLELPDRDVMIVGRAHPQNERQPDLDLGPFEASKRGVSRHHARLSRRGEVLYLEDLESMNGTFVNNRKLAAGDRVVLRANDRVRLGLFELIYRQTLS